MNDDKQVGRRPADIVGLKPEDLPQIPEIARITVSHRRISRIDWRNRSFKDFNALKTEFDDCDFRYSDFQKAYFRDAKFTRCRFDGARFSDCNFKNASFYECDLQFAQFQRCLLDVTDLIPSLPAEPNIRREALQNLRANAISVGDYASQRVLILQEIEATKRHYTYALRGYDSYYKNKYSTTLSKFNAGAKLAWLNISGLVWGHGEKPGRLLLSAIFLLCALALINFWSVMPRIGWIESHQGIKPLEYIIQLFLNLSPDQRFQGYVVIDYCVVVMRYVYIGLFISILYKSISHR
jgi:Pentapeptide repeats (9 copies)